MQTDRTVRVFISSPGDVEVERRQAAAVVRRLDREFRRFFSLQPYLWEQEAQRSSAHFQDYIQPPSEFDIVVLILWSRLGTPLPERTPVREYRGGDGRVPVTGTEWEYEEARARAERDGAPALLVFRNVSDTRVSSTDAASRGQKQAQLEGLDNFWRRHFEDRGVFLTAFTRYELPEQFEGSLEGQLRKVLRELSQKEPGPGPVPRISWFDRPFRGLSVYEFEHAPIFYGRDAVVRAATEQLVAAAAAGTAFVLLRGASGSGKSSLVRAGLLPELYVPRAVSGIGAWRRVLFQPRDNPEDLFLGIARRIAETGPGIGLAEMLSADFTVEKLARHLRENAAAPAAPFEQTLGQVAREMQDRGELLDSERVRLILIVDQLEELFTFPSISGEQREAFVKLLGGLARSGVVWVVTAIRSDFWHRVGELSELAALANGGRQLDLWPPNAAELTEIIRRPAAAAGLQFADDDHRVSLDSRLAEDAASAPGVLPLLSYTLEMLYARDVEAGHGRTLTWESYRDLGFLKGAIALRAEQALSNLAHRGVDEAVVARVFRRLVNVDQADGGRLVARVARLAEFVEGTPERLLVDKFLSAEVRLFVAEGDLQEARVRVAHEALLTEWERAKRLVALERVQFSRRLRLEDAEREWRTARQEDKPSLLLSRGFPLNEAEALEVAWGDELDSSLRTYITASHQAVNAAERTALRRKRSIMAATLSLPVIVGLAILTTWALIEKNRAQSAGQNAADAAVDVAQLATLSRQQLSEVADSYQDSVENTLDWAPPAWSAYLHRQKAYTLMASGKLSAARMEIDLARKANPDYLPALVSSSDLFVTAGDADKAARDADAYLQIIKTNTIAYGNSILAEAMRRNYSDAVSRIDEALQNARLPISDTESLVSPDIQDLTHGVKLSVPDSDFLLALRYAKAFLYAMSGDERFQPALAEADQSDRDYPYSRNAYLAALNWQWLIVRGQGLHDMQSAASNSGDAAIPQDLTDYGAYAIEGALWDRVARTRPEYRERARSSYEKFRAAYRNNPQDRYKLLADWVDQELRKPFQAGPPESSLVDRARALAQQAQELKAPAGNYGINFVPAFAQLSEAIDLLKPKPGSSLGRREQDLLIDLLLRRAGWRLEGNEGEQDKGGATDDARAVIALDPNVPEAYRLLAAAAFDDATRKTNDEQALNRDPYNSAALRNLASLIQNDDAKCALALLQKRQRVAASGSSDYLQIARLQKAAAAPGGSKQCPVDTASINLPDYAQALRSVETAIASAPWRIDLYAERRDIEQKMGGIDQVQIDLHFAQSLRAAAEYEARRGKDGPALKKYLLAFMQASSPQNMNGEAKFELDTIVRNLSTFISANYGRDDAGQFWRTLSQDSLLSSSQQQVAAQEASRLAQQP